MSAEDHLAIRARLQSLDQNEGVPMGDVLADFGLTMSEFESLVFAEEPNPKH